MVNCRSTLQSASLAGLYSIIVLMPFIPCAVYSQTSRRSSQNSVNMTGTVSQDPSNPLGIPAIRIVNYPQPNRYGESCEGLCPTWFFSALYDFSNQRSRVGGISVNSGSIDGDLAVLDNLRPYTSLDLSFIYSHATGSSPKGTSQTINEYVGSARLLQPLNPLFPGSKWKPAALSFVQDLEHSNCQFAIILGASYGGSLSSTDVRHFPIVYSSARAFTGDALLDYQFAWSKDPKSGYANLFFELSSGIQFDTVGLDSSAQASTSGRQLTYQNLAALNWSFWRRVGLLGALEWDAPLNSVPLRGSPHYYANTAIFTAGFTFNYNPGRRYNEDPAVDSRWDWNHWSLGLLYSYTAFDPFTETNELRVQVSYSF
jgi:hypothetical protein